MKKKKKFWRKTRQRDEAIKRSDERREIRNNKGKFISMDDMTGGAIKKAREDNAGDT